MKKFFMFAAMASVAFASCVKNEPVVSVAEQAEIAFDAPLLAPAVKSVAETTTATLPNFKVWGYFTATAVESFSETFSSAAALSNSLYMNGVVIGKDGNFWKSTGAKYYWPVNGSLTFLACAPSTVANVSVASNGLNIQDYEVPAAANEDLLVSKVAYGVNKAAHAATGAPIVFEHALSSILFKVKTTDEIVANGYTLTVKKISVKDAICKGTFAQVLEGDEHNMKSSTPANDGWSEGTTLQSYVAYTNETGITLTKDLQSTTTEEHQTDLILLPQELKETKVEVVFTLKNATMEGNAIEQTLTAKLAQGENPQQWLRGKRYVYNLTIDLEEIKFAPQVSPWEDGNVTPGYNSWLK